MFGERGREAYHMGRLPSRRLRPSLPPIWTPTHLGCPLFIWHDIQPFYDRCSFVIINYMTHLCFSCIYTYLVKIKTHSLVEETPKRRLSRRRLEFSQNENVENNMIHRCLSCIYTYYIFSKNKEAFQSWKNHKTTHFKASFRF